MTYGVTDILDDLDDLAACEDEISIGDVMAKMGGRGEGVFLLVPGIVGMSPLGGIPTVPSLLGLFVAIFCVQMLIGSEGLWMPGLIRRRSVSDGHLQRAVRQSQGVGRWLDRHFGKRLTVLTRYNVQRLAALICILLCLCIPPLEFVPFAGAIPMAAIAAFGLAITVRDGILMALAFAGSGLALWGAWVLMPF